MAFRPLQEGEQVVPLEGFRPLREDEALLPLQPPSPARQALHAVGDALRGGAETGATLLSGTVAEPLAGLAGIAQGVKGLIAGDEDPLADAAQRIEQVQNAFTYQPRTQTGREYLETLSIPFQKLQEGAQAAGQATLSATGSPLAATGVQTAIEAAPMALGARHGPLRRNPERTLAQRRRDVADVERQAKQTGFTLRGSVARQRRELREAGIRQTQDVAGRSASIPAVQTAVRNAREADKARVDALYREARGTPAGMPVQTVLDFPTIARRALADFDTATMPIVRRRIAELDALSELPANAVVRLKAIDNWRKRLNRNRPAKTDTAQNAAIDILKGQLDRFIDDQFNANMIAGDPAAVAKWRAARSAHQRYRETFTDNKVIDWLATRTDATPETVRSWIFGASATGAKTEAGAVVRRLKKIVGENSPEFTALRQDALLDIMEPLLRTNADLGAFVRNYDRVFAKNPTLAKELFPDSDGALKALRNLAAGVEKRAPSDQPRGLEINIGRLAAVSLFGHGLAKRAMTVNLAQQVFNLLRLSPGRAGQLEIMSEILGYNPAKSILPKAPVAIGGATQAAQSPQEQSLGPIQRPSAGVLLPD